MSGNCPLCKQPVIAPSLAEVIAAQHLRGFEAKILSAVWAAGGMPARTEQIFEAMYADDPDGGPTPSKMYLDFKHTLHHVQEKLVGSGVGIESVGFRCGYRLSLRAY